MTSFSRLLTTFLLPFLGLSCASKTVVMEQVIASGVGTSLQEAKNDAIRQGIQYAVGSYVTSDLEANGEIITKDTVTDYAGAIVERFEILNQILRPDGLYEMQARLQIGGNADRQRNRSAINNPGKVDGHSLQAEVLSRLKLQADSKRLWDDLLAGFPARAFKYAIVNPSISTIPNDHQHAILEFYSVGLWRPDFIGELRSLLENTGHPAKVRNGVPYGIVWIDEAPNDQQSGICLIKGFKTFSPWQKTDCYIVNVSSRHFDEWLCIKSGTGLEFNLNGFSTNALKFKNKSHKNLLPYLQVDRNGSSSTYVFQLVENKMIKDRADYQKLISALWSVNVPVDSMTEIKNISAQAKCS